MNAYRVREEAIGGAVRLTIGKLAEVAEGGAGFVCVNVGVHVDVLACKLDVNGSCWEGFTCACTTNIPIKPGSPIANSRRVVKLERRLFARIFLLLG
jgi:hypothetical protein